MVKPSCFYLVNLVSDKPSLIARELTSICFYQHISSNRKLRHSHKAMLPEPKWVRSAFQRALHVCIMELCKQDLNMHLVIFSCDFISIFRFPESFYGCSKYLLLTKYRVFQKMNTPKLSRDMSKTKNNTKLLLRHMCCTCIQVLFHVLQKLNMATTGSTNNIKPI